MRTSLQFTLETLRRNPMELFGPLAILAVSFLLGLLARRLVLRMLRAWTDRTGSRPGLILSDALHGPMLIWAIIVGAHLAIQASTLPVKVAAAGSKSLLVLW